MTRICSNDSLVWRGLPQQPRYWWPPGEHGCDAPLSIDSQIGQAEHRSFPFAADVLDVDRLLDETGVDCVDREQVPAVFERLYASSAKWFFNVCLALDWQTRVTPPRWPPLFEPRRTSPTCVAFDRRFGFDRRVEVLCVDIGKDGATFIDAVFREWRSKPCLIPDCTRRICVAQCEKRDLSGWGKWPVILAEDALNLMQLALRLLDDVMSQSPPVAEWVSANGAFVAIPALAFVRPEFGTANWGRDAAEEQRLMPTAVPHVYRGGGDAMDAMRAAVLKVLANELRTLYSRLAGWIGASHATVCTLIFNAVQHPTAESVRDACTAFAEHEKAIKDRIPQLAAVNLETGEILTEPPDYTQFRLARAEADLIDTHDNWMRVEHGEAVEQKARERGDSYEALWAAARGLQAACDGKVEEARACGGAANDHATTAEVEVASVPATSVESNGTGQAPRGQKTKRGPKTKTDEYYRLAVKLLGRGHAPAEIAKAINQRYGGKMARDGIKLYDARRVSALLSRGKRRSEPSTK